MSRPTLIIEVYLDVRLDILIALSDYCDKIDHDPHQCPCDVCDFWRCLEGSSYEPEIQS
jgi:hypothetical protein